MSDIISLKFRKNLPQEKKLEKIKKNVDIGDLVMFHYSGHSQGYFKGLIEKYTVTGYYYGLSSRIRLADCIGHPENSAAINEYGTKTLIAFHNLKNIDPHPITAKERNRLKEHFNDKHHYLYLRKDEEKD